MSTTITTTICSAANLAFLTGIHQPKDRYRMALYTDSADLGFGTKRYTSVGECSGPGYTPGGVPLEGYRAELVDGVACLTWKDPTWDKVSIQTAGALIYNASKSDAALVVLKFDQVWVPHNGEFTPNFPALTARTAVVRLGRP